MTARVALAAAHEFRRGVCEVFSAGAPLISADYTAKLTSITSLSSQLGEAEWRACSSCASDSGKLVRALQQVEARHLSQVAQPQRASRPRPFYIQLLRCEPIHASSHSTPSRVAGTLSIRLWLVARTAPGWGATPETRGVMCSCLSLAPIPHSCRVHRHATKEKRPHAPQRLRRCARRDWERQRGRQWL